MKFLLAVSGGVDSMVLLDWAVKKYGAENVCVAHFNHGTRKSADDDEKFVQKICAEKYGVECLVGAEKLGANVAEEKARAARYAFLFDAKNHCTEKYGATKLCVAHHMDDLVESVAINLARGTGWRGLAVMNMEEVERPLLSWTKTMILKYAAENEIVFREDPTNNDENYLRNVYRPQVRKLSAEEKARIFQLRERQILLKHDIEKLAHELMTKKRDFFRAADDAVAMEVLRAMLEQEKISCTRPQMYNFLAAIRNYAPGKWFNLPGDKLVKIQKDVFVI